jgi:hypothetical protein
MAAQFLDMYNLSQDPTFQNRCITCAIQSCITVNQEANTVAFHRERQQFAVAVLNSPTAFKPLFAESLATDVGVIADATANGTVSIVNGNAATQAALVTDAHIFSAFAGQFNTFFKTPGF